jgi:hypothetical protein
MRCSTCGRSLSTATSRKGAQKIGRRSPIVVVLLRADPTCLWEEIVLIRQQPRRRSGETIQEFTMARELTRPLSPMRYRDPVGSRCHVRPPPPRRSSRRLRCQRDQACQCAVSTPRENSELPANRPLQRLGRIASVTSSSGKAACHLLPAVEESFFLEASRRLNHTARALRVPGRWTRKWSPPAF